MRKKRIIVSLLAATALLACGGLRPGAADAAPKPGPTKVMPTRAGQSVTTLAGTTYFYNVGRQTLTAPDKSTGMTGNLRIQKPFLAAADFHSLAEIAVQSANSQQIVEVGFTVDRNINGGSSDPHIFVGSWVNNVFRGYNTSNPDWVDYAPNTATYPGVNINSAVGVSKQFNIQISGGNWWIGYDLQWLGYFKGSAWSGVTPAFDGGYLHQAFGEVAAASAAPCTDMGSGVLGNATSGIPARLGSLNLLTTPTAENFVASVQPSSASSVYAVNQLSATTIAYGGPGFC